MISISTVDHKELKATHYPVAAGVAPKGQLILCPAMGIKQVFYADFGQFMASQGFAVYTFDYRGMGASETEDLKGCSANLMDWAVDIHSLASYAKNEAPDLPLYAVTHSVGGQLLGLSTSAGLWDGIVTVASQSGYWKHWTGKHRVRMWIFWHAMLPVLSRLFGYFPAQKLGLFENLPKGVALQWSKWGRHPDYLRSEYPKAHFESISCPIRAYSFEDDEEFAPKAAVDWLHQQFGNAAVERFHVKPQEVSLKKIGHFNFFRASMKGIFWEDLVSFFEKESNKRLIKL